jgi:hypothetical protein
LHIDSNGIEKIEIIEGTNINSNTMKLVSKSVHITGQLKGKYVIIEADTILLEGTLDMIS